MSKLSNSQHSSGKPDETTENILRDSAFEKLGVNDRDGFMDNIDIFNYQLREPVSSIFASLPLLSESINSGDTEKANKGLQMIYEKTYIMLKSINNMSLAAKILNKSILSKSAVDLSSLVESVISSAKIVLPEYVHIEQEIQSGGVIMGNSGMLSHAICNLILNSIEYRKEDSVAIKITLKVTKENCIIKYVDNSIGIKSNIVPFIFDYYYTSDPYNDGEPSTKSGLGLYVAKAAFEEAGGTILFQSEFSEGVSYAINIPLYTDQKEQVIKSRPSDFILNRYSEMFIQLCEYCILPDLN